MNFLKDFLIKGLLTVVNYSETVETASGTSFTVDLSKGTRKRYTTTGNATITLPASVDGKGFVVEVVFGGAHTITWAGGTSLKWPANTAPTATSVNGKKDIYGFLQDGSTTDGSVFGQNY